MTSATEPRRRVSDAERRARLARRHGLAPGHRLESAEQVVTAMTALHATEAATPFLSVFARSSAFTVADLERALTVDRTLVKQLAMRRTLFVMPRALLGAVLGSVAARVAGQERARLAKEAVGAGRARDGDRWVAQLEADVLEFVAAAPVGVSAAAIRSAVPAVAGTILAGGGSKWAQQVPIAPRILTLLAARGLLVRGTNDGHWRLSKPTWAEASAWFGEAIVPTSEAAGYEELVRRALWTFGPATEADLVWWLGSAKGPVRRALAGLGAVPVALDGGALGYLLPDDLEPVPQVEPWAALLPVLDATTMGWRGRDFYLPAELVAQVFDRGGNAGTTAWWDGRIVGCWVQDPDGRVEVRVLTKLGTDARAALEAEAARLTAWLDGVRIGTVYTSPAMRPTGDGGTPATRSGSGTRTQP